jgi:hypothetical protein
MRLRLFHVGKVEGDHIHAEAEMARAKSTMNVAALTGAGAMPEDHVAPERG